MASRPATTHRASNSAQTTTASPCAPPSASATRSQGQSHRPPTLPDDAAHARATPRGRAGAAVWLTRRIGGRESRARGCRERSVEEVCNRTTQSRLTTLYPPPLIHRRDWGGEVYAFRLLPTTVRIWGRNPCPLAGTAVQIHPDTNPRAPGKSSVLSYCLALAKGGVLSDRFSSSSTRRSACAALWAFP